MSLHGSPHRQLYVSKDNCRSNAQEKMEVHVFEYFVGVNLEDNFIPRFAINNFPIDLHLSQLHLY